MRFPLHQPGMHGVPGVVVLLALSAMMPTRAELVPVRGQLDSRIRTAAYDPAQVYRLHGFVGYQIELEFEEGETFAGHGGGDLEGVAFGAHENHVILKPRAQNVGTNLVIYTNRRAYRIDYQVQAQAPDPRVDEVIYTVRFLYPPQPESVETLKQNAAQVQAALAGATQARLHNTDYWFCGDTSVKPVSAFDDGVHTRLSFGARAELPAVFVLNDDGTESLLNFNVEAGDIVIHRVARRLIVRRGGLTGCIVNQGFAGGGERLESGTLAPSVQRERRQAP